jgi:hypothetical protein
MNNLISDINWEDVVSSINMSKGEVRTIGQSFYQNNNGEFDHIINLWNQAGYTSNKVEWLNFYPEKHFDKNVEQHFSLQVNCTPVRSWISCVRPGKSAPWHQDIDDNLESYNKLGKLKRFTCFINEPYYGQVFMLEKKCFYMEPKGKIIVWDDYLNWHGASNCGFENAFLYHFLGY